MKNYSYLITLSLLALSPALYAQQQEDPIDQEYKGCLLKDSSQANICACAFTAYGKWEKEMNSAYKKLSKTVKTEKDKATLKQAQTAWTTYRDAEFSSYDHMFNHPGGNWCGIRQDNRIDVVRARAIQLRSYVNALKPKEKK